MSDKKKSDSKKSSSSSKEKSSSSDKKSSSSSKEKSDKGGEKKPSTKSAKPEVKMTEMQKLEKQLEELNGAVGHIEEAMKKSEQEIISIVQKVYNSLHGVSATKTTSEDKETPAGDGSLPKEVLKQLHGNFKKCQEEEKKNVQAWLALLAQQQELVQKIRLEVCAEAEENLKNQKPYALGLHTSQLLNQTTLSSSDALNVNWATFANQTFTVADLGGEQKFKKAKIGESPTSTVYKVEYKGVPVAAKEFKSALPAEELAHFQAKYQEVSKNRFPPLLYYIGLSADGKIVLTELAKSGSLASFKSNLAFDRKVKIARGLAVALNFLHTLPEKFVHGRLKPSNVMLTSDLKVKLADYGRINKLPKDVLVQGGYVPYMAPELFSGGSHSVASDVYAYGMLLYYLFYGTEPFPANNFDLVAAESAKDSNAVLAVLKTDTEKPESLRNHIRDCINPVANKRPDFEFILKRLKPFEKIIAEFLENTRGEAAEIWKTPVPFLAWNDFLENWKEIFGVSLNEKQRLMLRAIMALPLEGENLQVGRTDFELFLSWFGPVTKEALPEIWKYMEILLDKCLWFFGKISNHDAKTFLRGKDSSDADNFLVRLNVGEGEDKQEPFILAYRKLSDKKTYEFCYKPDFSQNPLTEINKYLEQKKIPTFKPCNPAHRNQSFARPFKAGAAHGMGYRTDTNMLPAIALDVFKS